MEQILKSFGGIKRALIIMPIVIVVLFIADIIYVYRFNQAEHSFVGKESDYLVGMTMGGRENSTSEWKKRDFDLYGETVDLNAQTIDGTFVNDSDFEINNWKMRINFTDDCFINNAWCGKVEIHQDVLTNEKVQIIDLRNYRLSEIQLDYLFDGDLLIRISKGDYIIYWPSEQYDEMNIQKQSKLTMGVILYYLDFPNLSDCEVTYSFNRRLTDGYEIYFLGALLVVWVFLAVIYAVYDITYRTAVKQMEIKKSGILSMSDIYSIIYIIDLKKNELMPLVADEESEKLRPKNMTASEQLKNMFMYDSMDCYKDIAYEFCDLKTLGERLKKRDTVVFEYQSIMYGWCRIRFFAMDRDDDKPLEKVVFTIQVINDEKAEMEAIAKRVDEAEHESKAKSIFLANMSHEIRTPINTVIGFDTMILRESKEPSIRSYAKSINSAANMLLSLINGILDISKLEADKMELLPEEYSFKQMLSEVISMIKGRAEFEKLEFVCEVSRDIPDKLYGDSVRLKQVITNLLTNAAKYTDEGNVKLTVYGKKHDNVEHLLISVKDTGIGITEEDQKKLTERFTRFDNKRNKHVEGTGIGLNLVTGILALMDSELHVVSTYGEGSDFYFELEQKIMSDEVIGNTDFNIEFNDDEYKALFYAPDAKVLVVDDNEMNISVFLNLLKETGLQIDTANSGKQAIAKCAEKKYDIIFMDHMMPEMDGVETFNHIREQVEGKNRDTCVIILTANALKGAKEEYEALGFTDFLAKPIQPEELEHMIIKHLDSALIQKKSAVKAADKELELPVLSGVDTAYGVAHTGDLKSYLALLSQFGTVADSELAELKGYIQEIIDNHNDSDALNAFRIKIHSMKATVNIMGALQVYGLAATLEEKAAKKQVDAVLSLVPFFVEAYEKLLKEVKECLPKESKEAKASIDSDTLDSLLHMLETSIKAYDIKGADSVIEKLNAYEWDETRKALIDRLAVAVAALNAEEAVELCIKIRG